MSLKVTRPMDPVTNSQLRVLKEYLLVENVTEIRTKGQADIKIKEVLASIEWGTRKVQWSQVKEKLVAMRRTVPVSRVDRVAVLRAKIEIAMIGLTPSSAENGAEDNLIGLVFPGYTATETRDAIVGLPFIYDNNMVRFSHINLVDNPNAYTVLKRKLEQVEGGVIIRTEED